MKRFFFLVSMPFVASFGYAQTAQQVNLQKPAFFEIKAVKTTPVKNQAQTGTCWSFSTTSLIETEAIRKNKQEIDLSEMYTVRNIYIEKAKNYILRQGHAQFSEGGLNHDMIHAVATYGAVPETVYNGLMNGQTQYNHQQLFVRLQTYLDSVLKKQPVSSNWLAGYTALLDQYIGKQPQEFTYEGKKYTPLSFAKEVLKFDAADYVSLTSFTHKPYYSSFILQVPDNFANGSFYNIPLNELVAVVKDAVSKGYSVAWDADVSNKGFRQNAGLALYLDPSVTYTNDMIKADTKEMPYDADIRQQLYENLTTQDDHLMHIVGTQKSAEGKTFFIVKNSWGKVGAFEGYLNVSEAYFGINTISIVLPKAALSKELLQKLR